MASISTAQLSADIDHAIADFGGEAGGGGACGDAYQRADQANSYWGVDSGDITT